MRGLAVLGLPLLVIGLLNQPKAEARLCRSAWRPRSRRFGTGIQRRAERPFIAAAIAGSLTGLAGAALAAGERRSRRWLSAMALLRDASAVLNLEYRAKEVPEGNPTWELAQRPTGDTKQARIISVSGGDPRCCIWRTAKAGSKAQALSLKAG